MRKDHFTDEALKAAYALAELKYSEDPEDQLAFAEAYNYTTCERPDGSKYGTSGQCRKGKETTPGSEDKPASKPKRKAAPRVSPREAASALAGRSLAKEAAMLTDKDFDPDKVGYKKAGQNIEVAKKAAKASSPEETKKKVNKAVKLINERIKRLREAELDPKIRENTNRIYRLQERQQELKTMIKYLKSGNSALASQAVLEKSLR